MKVRIGASLEGRKSKAPQIRVLVWVLVALQLVRLLTDTPGTWAVWLLPPTQAMLNKLWAPGSGLVQHRPWCLSGKRTSGWRFSLTLSNKQINQNILILICVSLIASKTDYNFVSLMNISFFLNSWLILPFLSDILYILIELSKIFLS